MGHNHRAAKPAWRQAGSRWLKGKRSAWGGFSVFHQTRPRQACLPAGRRGASSN